MNEKQLAAPAVESEIDLRTQNELRLFRRVLMSYIDFYQAKRISDHMLASQIYPGEREENRTLYEALNCATIIAYCRPFSGNDGSSTTLAVLPQRFLSALTAVERSLHDVVMADRNTVLAHSDSKAWEMEPKVLRLRTGNEILAPMHNQVHAPLKREVMATLNSMCAKLMEDVHKERQRLEPIVWKYLRTVDVANEKSVAEG